MDANEFKKLVAGLNKGDALVRTKEIGKVVLKEFMATSSETARSGGDVYARYKELIGDDDNAIPQSTFIQYLSKAARMKGTEILCDGRKQGYYTNKELAVEESEENVLQMDADEDSLYPILEKWMVGKGYQAKIVANVKRNGAWGNPDVLGLRVFDMLGRVDAEAITIECKKDLRDWRKWIFEAVAHTRFADRSYFAFAYPVDEVQKQADELFAYAEYFGVGLLVLELPRNAFEDFAAGRKTALGDIDVFELYPAPRRFPQCNAKQEYLKSIGISTVSDLYRFGEDREPVAGNVE